MRSKMRLTRIVKGVIQVEEIHDVVSAGVTEPVRCRLANGSTAIVKYPRNRMGQQVLVNEWIGSQIADYTGVSIPCYGLCHLSKEVINNTNNNEEISTLNAGIGFYTVYLSNTVPPQRGLLSAVKKQDANVERLFLFDLIVNNVDRHMGNLIVSVTNPPVFYAIDNSQILTNGHALSTEAALKKELESPLTEVADLLKNNDDVYSVLKQTIGYSKEEMLGIASELVGVFGKRELDDIKGSIPDIWIQSVGETVIDLMFQVLQHRISGLLSACESLLKHWR